ncbi:hypothetical protein [Algibacter sp. L3A6]|uniref:hypothetical protein n=1 Tax=Algibacter sp. L3A6 TaxID=2686366 RepID=UPI00131B5011|nr:hypothetical protein [Algibacter sp. L3A6]
MEIKGEIIEELGFEASKNGFFHEWQSLTDMLKKEKNISISEASEIAFSKLFTELN